MQSGHCDVLTSLFCKGPRAGEGGGDPSIPGHCVAPLVLTQAHCSEQSLGKGSSRQVSVGGSGIASSIFAVLGLWLLNHKESETWPCSVTCLLDLELQHTVSSASTPGQLPTAK